MPKRKTDRGAAARFKITGTGRIRRRQQNRAHLLEKKNSVRTRRLARDVDLSRGDRRPGEEPAGPLTRPPAGGRRGRGPPPAPGRLPDRTCKSKGATKMAR